MPFFNIPGIDLDLPRNVALLDTNVLVALADESDGNHEQALTFVLADPDYEFLIAPPVIVESCGLLSKRKNRPISLGLLAWLLNTAGVTLFPAPHPPGEVRPTLSGHAAWMERYRVDYVDAYLMEIAHRVTTKCDLRPHLPIVTFDAGDFLRCSGHGYEFSLYDMRDFQLVEFG